MVKNEDKSKPFANIERIKLIICLADAKNGTELLGHCNFSQSALSQHLKILIDYDIVVSSRKGKHCIYSVKNKKALTVAKTILSL